MRYTVVVAGVVAFLTVAFAWREAGAQPRTCVRATLDEAFVLPDGSWHPAGLLRICLDRELAPGAGLHTIVAEQAASRHLSRRTPVETEDRAASRLAFVRDRTGILLFRGYTLVHDGRVEAYWIRPSRSHGAETAAAIPTETVWLAAAVLP